MTAHTVTQNELTVPPGPLSAQRGRRGVTLPELLVVVVVIGILLSIVANRLPGFGNELENSVRETTSFIRLVRAEASVTTSAYRIVVASENTLRTEFARSCTAVPAAEWEPDGSRQLSLRDGVVFAGTEAQTGNVLLCFNPRGVANRSPRLTIRDRSGNERQIEALIGGGILVSQAGAVDGGAS